MRWGKPRKNKKRNDPRYFLNENIEEATAEEAVNEFVKRDPSLPPRELRGQDPGPGPQLAEQERANQLVRYLFQEVTKLLSNKLFRAGVAGGVGFTHAPSVFRYMEEEGVDQVAVFEKIAELANSKWRADIVDVLKSTPPRKATRSAPVGPQQQPYSKGNPGKITGN